MIAGHVPRGRRRWTAARFRPAYWLVGLHGVSSFCLGMVFPYTSIFLSGRPGVGTGGVAVYYAASGAGGLAVALVLGLGWVRPSRVALGLTGNGLSCLGYVLLPTVASLPAVGFAGALVGIGQGCFLAAVIPIMSSMVSEAETRRMFALRYQVLNATLALGSLAAGVLTGVLSPGIIRYLFLVNAVGYLPIAAALVLTRKAGEAGRAAREAEHAVESDGAGERMALGLLLRATIGVVLFELAIALFAYSQFETTGPLVAFRLMHAGVGWIPVMIAVNVAVVVVAQLPMTRLLERRRDVFGLRVAVALWAAGYVCVAGSTLLSPAFRLAGLIAYAAVFGLGECAYSCSYYPWMISKVPDTELTRVTALTNGVMGIGVFAGPAIGVTLVTTGSAPVVWLSLAALCSTAALATVRDRARRARPSAAQCAV